MKRIETFTFEFETREDFVKFWDAYVKTNPPGVKCSACSTGNLHEKQDELEKLLGDLYDIQQRNGDYRKMETETLEKVEKFLGI